MKNLSFQRIISCLLVIVMLVGMSVSILSVYAAEKGDIAYCYLSMNSY